MQETSFCAVGEAKLVWYVEGRLRAGERQEYERHVEGCRRCQEELELWQRLGEMPVVSPGAGFGQEQRWRSEGARAERGRTPVVSDRVAWVGLAAMLALGCGLGGFWLGAREGRTEAALAQKDLAHTRSLMAVSLLQQQSAIERLRGVNYSARLERADEAVVGALLATLRGDSSVDVRLAAADALRKFGSQRAVREAVAEALPYQESPMLQMTLIDTLAEWREPGAAGRLRELQERPETDQAVRRRIEAALAEWRNGERLP